MAYLWEDKWDSGAQCTRVEMLAWAPMASARCGRRNGTETDCDLLRCVEILLLLIDVKISRRAVAPAKASRGVM